MNNKPKDRGYRDEMYEAAVNAFEECANDRMEIICRMQKNTKKQVERV